MSLVILDTNAVTSKILNFNELEMMQSAIYSAVADLSVYVTSVCALGALLYICLKVFGPWSRGESIDFYSLLRPFVLGLVVMNFSFVPPVLDGILSPVNDYARSLKETSSDDYKSKTKSVGEALASYAVSNVKTAVSSDPDVTMEQRIDAIFKAVDVGNYIDIGRRVAVMNILMGVTMGLLSLISCALAVFVIVTKVVLVILGPLVFTLAIFPRFEHSVQQWICRYVNVSLWLPVANIIGFILQELYIYAFYQPIFDSITSGESLKSNTPLSYLSGGMGLACLYFLLACILYCMVPKITSWIIDENGAGMIGGAFASTGKAVASTAAGAAGAQAAVGVASKVI